MFEFLQSLSDFAQDGIYEFSESWIAFFIGKLTIWYIEMKISSITFAWEIAQSILSALSVTQSIAASFGALSPDVRSAVGFFRIPEAVNMLIGAAATRFVLTYVPFI